MIIIGPVLILTSSLCVAENLHINYAYTGCLEWYYLAHVYCFEEELIIVAYMACKVYVVSLVFSYILFIFACMHLLLICFQAICYTVMLMHDY